MLRALTLIDTGPAHELHLELGRRLNVMTGDNGLGKSFLLDVIWWALAGTWAGLPAWPRSGATDPTIEIALDDDLAARMLDGDHEPSDIRRDGGRVLRRSHFEFSQQSWSPRAFSFTARPLPAMVLYARADGGAALWDPARNFHALRPGPLFDVLESDIMTDPATLRRPPAYVLDSQELLRGKTYQGKTICSGLIRDWVSWQEKKPDTSGGKAFQHLCHALKALSPNPTEEREVIRPGKPVRLFLDDTLEYPTIDSGYGEVPILHASAGMKRIVSLAYLIVWAWHEHVEASRILKQDPVEHVVFLMDEVENHLHPEWQRRILPALLRVLHSLAPSMKIQVHVTTHAPMVLASLEPHFDEADDQLFVFDLEAGAVVLRDVPWARQGDAARWLASPYCRCHRDRAQAAR